MHAFLISDPRSKISDLGSNNPDVLHVYPDKSIGIAEVRSVQTFLSRKPIQSPVNTVVIHDAELLTIPAQNAFLKTLEEPPANSVIYLVTVSPDNFLPTVLSRVQRLSGPDEVKDHRDFSPSLQLFNQVLSSSLAEKVGLLESKNFTKTAALEFLTDLEQAAVLHPDLLSVLPHLWDTKKLLTANVNVRLSLGDFFFSLPSGNNLRE